MNRTKTSPQEQRDTQRLYGRVGASGVDRASDTHASPRSAAARMPSWCRASDASRIRSSASARSSSSSGMTSSHDTYSVTQTIQQGECAPPCVRCENRRVPGSVREEMRLTMERAHSCVSRMTLYLSGRRRSSSFVSITRGCLGTSRLGNRIHVPVSLHGKQTKLSSDS